MQQEDRQNATQYDGWRERRIDYRQPTAVEASVNFLVRDLKLKGQMENLSPTGARFAAAEPCPRGAGHLVELIFDLAGCSFRLTAVVQWNDGSRLGLQFEPLAERRRQELQQVLVLESIRQGVERDAARAAEQDSGPWTETVYPADDTPIEILPLAALTGTEGWRERRAHSRVTVELPAAIYLVNCGVKMSGRVADLCLGGCRIHLDQRLEVGIYTRVEAGFYHLGMPFRVGGVIQAIHEPKQVGIRFLDVTERIGAKLADLMKELEGEERPGD